MVCYPDSQADQVNNQPDNETSSGEEGECPAEIEPINLQGQETQALDITPAALTQPSSPAASAINK